jgi:uncharacterized protein (DUF736 family)
MSFLARQESPRAPSFAALRANAAAPIASEPTIAIEAARARLRSKERNDIMATIGNFTKDGESFKGSIITLSVQAKNVRIIPETSRTTDKAPTHRVFIGDVEVGAGWAKTTNDDRHYLSLKLDDPTFTAPIFPTLFENQDGGHDLIWTRPQRSGAND